MKILGTFFLISCLWYCSKTASCPDLQIVGQLMETHPDSALCLLETIDTRRLTSEESASYALLYTQALDKNHKVIQNDSLIRIAVDYYSDQQDMLKLAEAKYYWGCYYMYKEQKEEAVKVFLDAEKIALPLEAHNLLGLISYRIAILRENQFSIKQAQESFSNSAYHFHKANNLKNESITLLRKGNIFRYTKQYDSCIYYLNKALWMAQTRNDTSLLALTHNYKGNVYIAQGYIQSAKREALEALRLLKEKVSSDYYILLGDVYLQENKLDSAEYFIKKYLNNTQKEEIKPGVFTRLQKIYEKKNFFYQALLYAKEASTLTDSMYRNYKKKSILQFEQKYRYEQLQREAALLKAKEAWLWVIVIGLGSLIMIIVALYQYVVGKRKRELIKYRLRLVTFEHKLKAQECSLLLLSERDQKLKEIVQRRIEITKKIIVATTLNGRQEVDYKKILTDLLALEKWEEFCEGINILYDGFVEKLKKNYPMLTDTDLKLCCLTCAGFTTKEIASFMQVMDCTVNNRRYEIMKKIEGKRKLKFKDFIREIANKCAPDI